MDNLEYLEKAKKQDEDLIIEIDRIANNSYPNNIGWAREFRMTFRKMKALEIIAEELCKLNLTANVLSSVIEAVTNQGNSLNINGRVSIHK